MITNGSFSCIAGETTVRAMGPPCPRRPVAHHLKGLDHGSPPIPTPAHAGLRRGGLGRSIACRGAATKHGAAPAPPFRARWRPRWCLPQARGTMDGTHRAAGDCREPPGSRRPPRHRRAGARARGRQHAAVHAGLDAHLVPLRVPAPGIRPAAGSEPGAHRGGDLLRAGRRSCRADVGKWGA